jgi:hypothetical protein
MVFWGSVTEINILHEVELLLLVVLLGSCVLLLIVFLCVLGSVLHLDDLFDNDHHDSLFIPKYRWNAAI